MHLDTLRKAPTPPTLRKSHWSNKIVVAVAVALDYYFCNSTTYYKTVLHSTSGESSLFREIGAWEACPPQSATIGAKNRLQTLVLYVETSDNNSKWRNQDMVWGKMTMDNNKEGGSADGDGGTPCGSINLSSLFSTLSFFLWDRLLSLAAAAGEKLTDGGKVPRENRRRTTTPK